MTTVTLSPKFQLVIPQDVREAMDLQPGTKMSVFKVGSSIQFVPVPTLAELQKELRGCGANLTDEPERF